MTETHIVFPTTKISIDSAHPAEAKTCWLVAAHYYDKGCNYWKVWPDLWTTRDAAEKKATELSSRWHHRQIIEVRLEPNP